MTYERALSARRHCHLVLDWQDKGIVERRPIGRSWRQQAVALLEQANAVIRAHDGEQPDLREVA